MTKLALHPATRKDAPMARHDLNFLEFLQTFRRGELLAEGDAKLTELVEALAI